MVFLERNCCAWRSSFARISRGYSSVNSYHSFIHRSYVAFSVRLHVLGYNVNNIVGSNVAWFVLIIVHDLFICLLTLRHKRPWCSVLTIASWTSSADLIHWMLFEPAVVYYCAPRRCRCDNKIYDCYFYQIYYSVLFLLYLYMTLLFLLDLLLCVIFIISMTLCYFY